MAAFFGKKLVVPIGCSCITELQLKSSKRLLPSVAAPYFFDWAGTSADSTIEVLNRRAPFIRSADDLELVNGRARARYLRNITFWHINEFFRIPVSQKLASLSDYPEGMRKFLDHHRYVVAQLSREVDEMHCLWTTVQPNLKHVAEEVGEPWSNSFLTARRYAAIKEACTRLPARKITVWFVSRGDHLDPGLVGQPGVFIMDVPHSPTEFRGEIGLFDPVFEKMGVCRPAPR